MRIKRTDTSDPDFLFLEKQLDAELRSEFPNEIDDYQPYNKFEAPIKAVLFYESKKPVACGAIKELGNHIEIKRMFVHPDFRRKGYSRQILYELESWGKEVGASYAILETGDKLYKARSLYESSGYTTIPKYGPYVDLPASICYQKTLNNTICFILFYL